MGIFKGVLGLESRLVVVSIMVRGVVLHELLFLECDPSDSLC